MRLIFVKRAIKLYNTDKKHDLYVSDDADFNWNIEIFGNYEPKVCALLLSHTFKTSCALVTIYNDQLLHAFDLVIDIDTSKILSYGEPLKNTNILAFYFNDRTLASYDQSFDKTKISLIEYSNDRIVLEIDR